MAAAEEEARRQQEDKEDENMLLDAEERALFEETEANLRAEVTYNVTILSPHRSV